MPWVLVQLGMDLTLPVLNNTNNSIHVASQTVNLSNLRHNSEVKHQEGAYKNDISLLDEFI